MTFTVWNVFIPLEQNVLDSHKKLFENKDLKYENMTTTYLINVLPMNILIPMIQTKLMIMWLFLLETIEY